MSLIEQAIDRALAGMSSDERRELILSVVERMLAQMDAPARLQVMEHVVEHFLDGLSAEERQETVRQLVPRLMAQLLNSGNMSVDEFLWSAMGSLGALERSQPGDAGES